MRKSKSVIGKDVISHADGVKLSSVKDLIVGNDNTSIVALLVESGGMFSSAKIVLIKNVETFGKDAVVVVDSTSVIPIDYSPEVDNIVARNEKLIGKKVFTEDGKDQGAVSDIYFDEQTAQITGYELSGGLIDNIASGTSYLPLDDIVNIGPDIILIYPIAAEALDAQVGGVQGAIQAGKEKVQDAAQGAQQSAEDAAVGRRAGTEVEDDAGSVIVASGQTITSAIVDEARSKGKLAQVLASAGLGQAQQAGDATGGALGQAGNTVGQVAGQAADKAGSLWDQFTRKISELTDSAGNRVDEAQTKQRLQSIQDAVGRPVAKVILDRQDNVILNLGDVITHEAIQKAYDGGELDSLLNSVYKGEVQFTKEEMMAPQEGQATVEKASGNAPMLDEMQQKVDQAQQQRDDEKEQKKADAEQQRQQAAGQPDAAKSQPQNTQDGAPQQAAPAPAADGRPIADQAQAMSDDQDNSPDSGSMATDASQPSANSEQSTEEMRFAPTADKSGSEVY